MHKALPLAAHHMSVCCSTRLLLFRLITVASSFWYSRIPVSSDTVAVVTAMYRSMCSVPSSTETPVATYVSACSISFLRDSGGNLSKFAESDIAPPSISLHCFGQVFVAVAPPLF